MSNRWSERARIGLRELPVLSASAVRGPGGLRHRSPAGDTPAAGAGERHEDAASGERAGASIRGAWLTAGARGGNRGGEAMALLRRVNKLLEKYYYTFTARKNYLDCFLTTGSRSRR